MNFIKADMQHLAAIMQLFYQAQQYLAEQGVDQWQNGYPTPDIITNDIDNQESFLVINEEAVIMGTTMFTTKAEQTYQNIEGDWLTAADAKYGVIHRMAVHANFRKVGVAKFVFEQCEQMLIQDGVTSMRIDTHEDNQGMQKLLRKLNYQYCGVIYLENGDKRLGFEKLIS